MEKQEFSSFQRYFNYLTFYLFTLSVKYKHLEDYDEEGPFENHYKKFFEIKTKLNEKIQDDNKLLINRDLFKQYYDSLSKMDYDNEDILIKIKKYNKNFEYDKSSIQNLYFELSDKLSKSKIRLSGIQLIGWGVTAFVFALFILLLSLYNLRKWIDFFVPLVLFLIPIYLFYYGGAKLIAIKQKNISNFKFNHMFSSDYCFQKIRESERFFFEVYKINNDYFEISDIELKFPEIGNLFERTINETELSDSNKEKLLIQNKNLYVRVVFSEFFKLLLQEGIEQYQQIPFMFVATLNKAKLQVQGNTAFSECINHICKNKEFKAFTDTTFNQAKAKYKNEEDLFDKYRKILKKYENILQ